MKTIIIANTLLFVFFALLLTYPLLAAAYLATLLYISKRSHKVGGIWSRYYKLVIKLENALMKGGLA